MKGALCSPGVEAASVRVQVIGHRVQAGVERGEARGELQTKEEIRGGRSEASKSQRSQRSLWACAS